MTQPSNNNGSSPPGSLPPPPGYYSPANRAPPPPPSYFYRRLFDNQCRQFFYVLTPCKRPSSESHPTVAEQKKPRTGDGDGEARSLDTTASQSASPLSPIPSQPSSTSPTPPSPPTTTEQQSPFSSPDPQPPCSPSSSSPLPPTLQPAESPAEPQLSLPAATSPPSTQLQSEEPTPTPTPTAAAAAAAVSLVPEAATSTEEKERTQNVQGIKMNSPLVGWFSNLGSKHMKQVDCDQDAEMCGDEGGCLKNIEDPVRTPLVQTGHSWEAPLEIPSSPEETKPPITPLSKLKQPLDSPNLKQSNLTEERMNLVRQIVSLLVLDLTNTLDLNQMVNLANGAFTYFDSLEIYYLPLYKAVHALISYQYEKGTLDIEKKGPAFASKARHDELVIRLRDAKIAKSRALNKTENLRHKIIPIRARVVELLEQLRKAEEAQAEGEAELADAKAEMVLSDEVHSKVQAEVAKISGEMNVAKLVVDDVDRRWNEVIAGIQQTKDELLVLRK